MDTQSIGNWQETLRLLLSRALIASDCLRYIFKLRWLELWLKARGQGGRSVRQTNIISRFSETQLSSRFYFNSHVHGLWQEFSGNYQGLSIQFFLFSNAGREGDLTHFTTQFYQFLSKFITMLFGLEWLSAFIAWRGVGVVFLLLIQLPITWLRCTFHDSR